MIIIKKLRKLMLYALLSTLCLGMGAQLTAMRTPDSNSTKSNVDKPDSDTNSGNDADQSMLAVLITTIFNTSIHGLGNALGQFLMSSLIVEGPKLLYSKIGSYDYTPEKAESELAGIEAALKLKGLEHTKIKLADHATKVIETVYGKNCIWAGNAHIPKQILHLTKITENYPFDDILKAKIMKKYNEFLGCLEQNTTNKKNNPNPTRCNLPEELKDYFGPQKEFIEGLLKNLTEVKTSDVAATEPQQKTA